MTAEATEPAAPRKKGLLLPLIATLVAAGVGFALTFLGLLPLDLLKGGGGHESASDASVASQITFVDLPPVVTSVAGAVPRQVVIAAKLEVPGARRPEVEHMLPRVADAVTSFIAGIDPAAFDKRGILEIIRTELLTRVTYVLGEGMVNDLLITEFSVQ